MFRPHVLPETWRAWPCSFGQEMGKPTYYQRMLVRLGLGEFSFFESFALFRSFRVRTTTPQERHAALELCVFLLFFNRLFHFVRSRVRTMIPQKRHVFQLYWNRSFRFVHYLERTMVPGKQRPTLGKTINTLQVDCRFTAIIVIQWDP